MSRERFIERQAEVRKAAERLREAVAEPESAIVRDAVIQRHECGGPRATLKKAFAEGLIATLEEADVWLQMLEDRNLTSHAYDEALATRIYQHVAPDYTAHLGRMADKIQTLTWD